MTETDPIAEILAPLLAHRNELLAEIEMHAIAIKGLTADLKRVERVLKASNTTEVSSSRIQRSKKKIAQKKVESIFRTILDHTDNDQSFTLNEVHEWASVSRSSAGEALKVLRAEERIRSVGTVPRRPGQMGKLVTAYRLMPNGPAT